MTSNPGESPWKCTICDKILSKNEHLLKHIRVVHQGQRKHVCPTCGKKFAEKQNMERHIQTHEG